MSKIKYTPLDNSYCEKSGAYEEDYHKLYSELVPSSGCSKTIHGELLRCASNLYHEFFNNGNFNAVEIESSYETEYNRCNDCDGDGTLPDEEDCEVCGGSGEKEEDVEYFGKTIIVDHFQNDIDIIKKYAPEVSLKELQAFMIKLEMGDDPESKIYDKVLDEVMFHILSTENLTL